MLVAVLGLSVLGLRHYQEVSRGTLLERFDQRVAQAAGFVGVYLDELGERSQLIASRQLAGETIGNADVANTIGDLGVPLGIVLDDAGRLVAADPSRDELLGQDLAASYGHLAQALAGRRAVSDVVSAAGIDDPIVALATPYDTPFGRRVLSLGFRPGATPLNDYLADLVQVDDVTSYLLDSQGNVLLATQGTPGGGPTDAVPALQEAVSRTGPQAGLYTVGGQERRYVVAPIEATSWVLLSTVPNASILAPLETSLWLERIGLLLLVVAVCGALWLLWRLAERDRRLLVANRSLDEALQLRGMFIDVASHELRTPMTVIHGSIVTLVERWSDLPEDRRLTLIQGVRRHSDRLVDLVEDVLEMSRLQGGRAVGTSAPTHVATVVQDAVATSVLEVDDVVVDCPGHLTASVDPMAAQRIVRNLLDNAARYGQAPIAVSGRTDGDTVRIEVTDAGPGVPEDFVAHMFEPFVQAGTSDNHAQGSGLGLAIAHGLAAEMGGELVYRSMPLTTFELILPTAGPAEDGHDEGDDAGARPLVDDDDRAADVTTR